MLGYDAQDFASPKNKIEAVDLSFKDNLKGRKFGIITSLVSDSIYKLTIEKIQKAGGELVEITPPEISYAGFRTLLSADMKKDLPAYLKNYANKAITVNSVSDVIDFNILDTIVRAPYGQALFEGIKKDSTSAEELETIVENLRKEGRLFLESLHKENLDAILSINNYHSGVSAMANYPNLTVPMGYKDSGEPISLTFIGKPYSEEKLLNLGFAFEQLTKARKIPENYN